MQHEELNNLVRQKLDNMSAVPAGLNLNATEAWNKLEGKLTSRKTNYKTAFLIAASLILLITCSWLIYTNVNKTGISISKNSNKQNFKEAGLPIEKETEIYIAEQALNEQPINSTKRTVQSNKHIKEKRELVDKTLPPSTKPNINYADSIRFQKEIETVEYTKPQKKLRIIHINEASQPEKPATFTADNNIKFRFSLFKLNKAVTPINEEQFTSPLTKEIVEP